MSQCHQDNHNVMNCPLRFHGIKGKYKPLSSNMKENIFFWKETNPPFISATILTAPIVSTASTLDLIVIVLMVIYRASKEHIFYQPQIHLATTSTMSPSGTLPVSLYFIVSCILDLGKYWNTTVHALLVYLLLIEIIILCG